MSRFSLRREIAFGLGVYALYLAVGRLVMRRDGRMRARANAERIVALEERLGVDVEPVVQRAHNPVAAMPSLHVAFAVVTGAELADRTDSRTLQVAAHAYAPLVATLVAGTGNHYVLDAVAGAALGAAARRSS